MIVDTYKRTVLCVYRHRPTRISALASANVGVSRCRYTCGMELAPGGKTGASNASNAAPVSHTRTCTLYTSNQTFIRLSGVSHPDRSMPFLRSFSVKFLSYITYARVWETGAALLALLALLGASIRT